MAYSDLNTYLKRRFGAKVYKAAVSLATTCPNRDGRKGYGGCAFCSNAGSGDFIPEQTLSVTEQIDGAIERLRDKVPADTLYIAYFQSFTNTYVSPEVLEKALTEAFSHPKVVMVSLGTRPDCLPDDILDVLERMNRIKPVMVELGLQTMHDKTAESFNRCYKTEEFEEAVRKLKKIGCETVAHLIFGLPGETREMMLQSTAYAVGTGIDGIKFTCLYVLKGSRLGEEYEKGTVEVLGKEEYFDIVEEALKLVPSDVIVHRLTGDGPKKLLLAPMWTANKRDVINYINRRFRPGN